MLFSFGVFLTPLASSFGTTTGPIAPLFSGAVLFYYLSGAIGGWVSDRYGIRRVVGFGAASISIGLLATAQAEALWIVYVIYVPLVGIGVGCCYAPLIGTVGRWFQRRRTMATALLLIGVSGGTLVVPLTSRYLIDTNGWRSAFTIYGVVAFIVLGFSAVVTTDAPGPRPETASLRAMLGSRRLLGLYLSVIVIGPGFYAPLAFYNDYATEVGVSTRLAAALVGIIGASSLVARFVFGVVGDRLGSFRLYRLGYGFMLVGLVVWLLAGASFLLLVAGAIAHGIGWAAWVTATPVVLAAWFGTRNLGGIVGAFYTGLGIGALVGPAVSGFVIDRQGYRPAIAVVVATTALAYAIALVSTRGAGLTFHHE